MLESELQLHITCRHSASSITQLIYLQLSTEALLEINAKSGYCYLHTVYQALEYIQNASMNVRHAKGKLYVNFLVEVLKGN